MYYTNADSLLNKRDELTALGINWEEQESFESVTHISSIFLEYVRDSFLYQHVKDFTRYRDGQEPSILDLIFTNEEDMIQQLDYRPPIGNSDHVSLVFKFLTGSVYRKYDKVDKRQYFKGNYPAVNDNLTSVNWKKSWHKVILKTHGEDLPISLTKRF